MIHHSGIFAVFILISEYAFSLDRCVPPGNNFNKFNYKFEVAHDKIANWVRFDVPRRSGSFLADKLRLQGKSYAGKSEFPWLVELRCCDTENWEIQDEWANGNLVTSKHVLTTCDALVIWELSNLGGFAFDGDSNVGAKNYYMVTKNPEDHIIMYSSDYPYVTTFRREDEVGTRRVKAFYVHPKCSYFLLDYSLGVVEVKGDPLNPYPPYTSYMHMDSDCNAFQRMKGAYNSLTNAVERDSPKYTCYVGLWGRKIFGDDRFTTVGPHVGAETQYNELHNHKLRYAVRFVDPRVCKANIRAFPQRFQLQNPDYFECMGLHKNETVGVICNHDRGAPVVCDGAVRAIVLAGATETFCNNSVAWPFLVLDARFMYPMWTNIKSSVFQQVTPHGRG